MSISPNLTVKKLKTSCGWATPCQLLLVSTLDDSNGYHFFAVKTIVFYQFSRAFEIQCFRVRWERKSLHLRLVHRSLLLGTVNRSISKRTYLLKS